MPDIYSYTDYRRFIRDFYREKKRLDKGFSYQRFAALAGFKSKTFLLKVMNGEKALARQSIRKVAEAMGLGKRETRFFELLVNFNEGKTIQEREEHFRRLRSFKYTHKQVRMRSNQFVYFSRWYYPVVRELVTLYDFGDNYQRIANEIMPHISAGQAERAVKFLRDMGLIERDRSGRYRQSSSDLTTGNEVVSVAVSRFQKDTLALAGESLDRFPPQVRDISTLTVGVSEQGFRAVKKRIQEFRKELVELVHEDKDSDRVYQINFQLFPLSSLPKKEAAKTGRGRK